MIKIEAKRSGARQFRVYQVDPSCFLLEVEAETGARREAAFCKPETAAKAGAAFIQGTQDPRGDWLRAINA